MRIFFLLILNLLLIEVAHTQGAYRNVLIDRHEFIDGCSEVIGIRQFKTLYSKGDNYFISVTSKSPEELTVQYFSRFGKSEYRYNFENENKLKFLHFYGAISDNSNLIHVFYAAVDSATPKGHVGLFKMSFNMDILKEGKVQLLKYIPDDNRIINSIVIAQSSNKKYFSLLIEPRASVKDYSHSLLVYNDSFELKLNVIQDEGKFDEDAMFKSVSISDEGIVYIIYEQRSSKYSSNTFQYSSEYAYIMSYNESDIETIKEFKPIDKSILHLNYFSEDGVPLLFYSWYKYADDSKSGFSIVDPNTLEEIELIEFEPELAEPYIEIYMDNKYTDVSERQNKLSSTKVNGFYDIVGYCYNKNKTYYVVQKLTPVKFSGYGYSALYSSVAGDIFVLELNSKKCWKIDRIVSSYWPSRAVSIRSDDRFMYLYYYSKPDANEKVERPKSFQLSADGGNRSYDSYAFKSRIDYETGEIHTESIDRADRSNYLIMYNFKNQIAFEDSLFVIGKALIDFNVNLDQLILEE